MTKLTQNIKYLLIISFLGFAWLSCVTKHTTSKKKLTENNKQIAEFRKGDLVYEVYKQEHLFTSARNVPKSKNIKLSIRIVNKRNSESPLRAICQNLDEYNINYAYFLNEAKNDLLLKINGNYLFPKYYSFENNYNAFPFETINIGYTLNKKQVKSPKQLIFIDRLFTKDSIFFNLNLIK